MERNAKHRNGLRHRKNERFCVCTECGERSIHKRGYPCQEQNCPKCGAKMLRAGSYHFNKWQKEKAKEEES